MSATLELNENTIRPVLQHFNEQLGQYINANERNKLGKVLTILDASIADREQRKALKDLVNEAFWGGDRSIVSEGGMYNPHSDMRAICELFGFDLYPEIESGLHAQAHPYEKEDLGWIQKRYKNALDNRTETK